MWVFVTLFGALVAVLEFVAGLGAGGLGRSEGFARDLLRFGGVELRKRRTGHDFESGGGGGSFPDVVGDLLGVRVGLRAEKIVQHGGGGRRRGRCHKILSCPRKILRAAPAPGHQPFGAWFATRLRACSKKENAAVRARHGLPGLRGHHLRKLRRRRALFAAAPVPKNTDEEHVLFSAVRAGRRARDGTGAAALRPRARRAETRIHAAGAARLRDAEAPGPAPAPPLLRAAEAAAGRARRRLALRARRAVRGGADDGIGRPAPGSIS
mmetsp:Transcript_1779/g.5586  ORF Transcript_1779/g.5586 Transcript_1779/m.5586 type:complete len:267 (+) Transcript_1779:831-1631(+)